MSVCPAVQGHNCFHRTGCWHWVWGSYFFGVVLVLWCWCCGVGVGFGGVGVGVGGVRCVHQQLLLSRLFSVPWLLCPESSDFHHF